MGCLDNDLTFEHFEPRHLLELELSEAADYYRAVAVQSIPDGAQLPGLAWTVRLAGRAVGCAGIDRLWEGRGLAWAIFESLPPCAWIPITRRVRQVLAHAETLGFRRIEATVDSKFAAGIRWINCLGFEVESELALYSPEGRSHFGFARLNWATGATA